MPDMVGHRTSPSRWMNIAYHHSQSSRTNVVWRWVSGSTPGNWWAKRVVNDNDTHPAMGPQVIYSPGAAASGSGVVYPGTGSPVNDLYFAAPWLTPTARSGAGFPRLAQGDRLPGQAEDTSLSSRPNASPGPVRRQAASDTEQPAWAFAGNLGEAFRIAGLARHPSGPLFAAATTREAEEANTGTVFRSDDGGETWGPVPPLPHAWWLDSILITDEGTLLVGGMMYNLDDPERAAHAAIYRSDDLGEVWTVAGEWMGTGSVHALLQRRNGDVMAGTGPGGLTLVSHDDGESWQPLDTPPQAEHIHALAETGDGRLYAGGQQKGETGVVYRLEGEEIWETVEVIDNPAAVHALLAGDDGLLYAGVAFPDGTGRVHRSFDEGEHWEPSEPLGDSQAVRALLAGAEGRLYAGLDMGAAQFTSYVYVSEDHGASWQDAGYLFMADAVHDLLLTPTGAAYAASGDTYGVTFRAELAAMPGDRVYLPLVVRDS
jgi:hypothetical protein